MNKKSLIGLCMVCSVFWGCTTSHFYNANYPRDKQQYYMDRDKAQCSNVAQGIAPMPPVNYIDSSPRVTAGRFNVTDGGKTYSGNYSSYTYSTDYTASFVNGMNLGTALATPFRQERIANNCLAVLGWYQIKHKYDIPPPEGNDNLKIIMANLEKNGFVNARYVNGVYYMIRSLDVKDDEIKMIIADVYQNGQVAGGKTYMYGIADWIIKGNRTAYVNEYTAYDINNNKILEEKERTKDFDISKSSMLHVYLLDYNLI